MLTALGAESQANVRSKPPLAAFNSGATDRAGLGENRRGAGIAQLALVVDIAEEASTSVVGAAAVPL